MLGARIPLVTLILAVVAALLFASPSSAPGKGHGRRSSAGAQPASQLRGAMVTPNWSIQGSPFALDSRGQQAEIQRVCGMGGDLIRFHVDWSQLQPGAHAQPAQPPSPPPVFGPPILALPFAGSVHPAAAPAETANSDTGRRDPGDYNADYLTRIDQVMAWSSACHIRVIADVIGSPCWAIDPATACKGSSWIFDPPRQGTFETLAHFLLARYPDLYGLEVWNEPNGGFWNGTASQYAALVGEAVAARNDVGSRTKIIAGALLGDGAGYLEQLYAAGMHGQDGISIHPYSMACASGCNRFVDPSRGNSPFQLAIRSVHRVMQLHHDTGGLYLTEFGFATCPATPACVSEPRAARWLARSFQVASRYGYINGLTAFSMRDFAQPSDRGASWDMRSGIVNRDLTAKPAFGAVKRTISQLAR